PGSTRVTGSGVPAASGSRVPKPAEAHFRYPRMGPEAAPVSAAAAKTQRRLTCCLPSVTIDTMETKNPITDVLRQAILDSGLPLLQIAEATGVERASLSRFVAGKRSLRLDMADKLAAYFGLTLTKTEKTPTKKGKKG